MQYVARVIAAAVGALLVSGAAALALGSAEPPPRPVLAAREPVVNWNEPDPIPGAAEVVSKAQGEHEAAVAAARRHPARVARRRPVSAPSGAAPLACIARNEGSPAYNQHDGDPYSGRYQFDQRTWNGAVSRAGHPEHAGRPAWQAPPEVQDAAARQLYAERGLQPWPPSRGRC